MTDLTEPEAPVLCRIDDGIAHVTINRPERMNALNPEVVVRLAGIWDSLAEDTSVRVAVLTGAGTRAFCAGGDLGTLIPLLSGARQAEDEWDVQLLENRDLFNRAMLRTAHFTVPVIAAIRGFALAGGTELALAADLRIAADDSAFGLTEVSRGLIPGAGGLARLSRQIPYTFAALIALVGERVSAQEALAMGLVTQVVPADEVLAVAETLARRMAENAPLAMRAAKRALVSCGGTPLGDALNIEDDLVRSILKTKDAREGPRAFIEKRTPVFTGE